MKNMKTFLISISLIFLSIFGCTDNEVDLIDRTYIIENDTEFTIDIKFYNKINNGLNIETSGILNSKGDRLSEKIQIIDNLPEGLPASAFIADSVKVIINGNKFFTCVYNFNDNQFTEPLNRNIFRHSNYVDLGNEKYLFKITKQDYESAEDCNGNCN